MVIFWAIAFLIFLALEIATATALVTIWLAAGSLIALFFAAAGVQFWVQCVIFLVSSVILLVFTRPAVRKLLVKTQPTNFELYAGKSASVIETVRNDKNEGRVLLEGAYWSARSADGSEIAEGQIVTVVKVDGSKLIVRI